MVIARNKKANFDYFILDKFECGIELVGTEVKSIREGKVSIKESYVKILKQELFILNMHIKAYDFGNINNKYIETKPYTKCSGRPLRCLLNAGFIKL